MKEKISIEPIGYIYTKYEDRKNTPPQGRESEESHGYIQIEKDFLDGICDLKENTYITIIFYFNRSKGYKLITPSRLSIEPMGVFSTRSPDRPNSLGITSVKITKIEKDKIFFLGADMLNKTPVIDIKPTHIKPIF